MKKFLAIITSALAVMACGGRKAAPAAGVAGAGATVSFATARIDTTVAVSDSADSAQCHIQINLLYADTDKPCAINDSVKALLAADYFRPEAGASVPDALRDFVGAYVRNYREEASAMLAEGAPAGTCCYQLILSSGIINGSDSVASYTAERYDFCGGAHGNTVLRAIGYDPRTLATLTIDQVVGGIDRARTTRLITEGVMRHFQKRSLAGLRDIGVFGDTEPYIPQNVVFNPDSASFVFNQYDIAPYAAGRIVVNVAYADMKAAKPGTGK